LTPRIPVHHSQSIYIGQADAVSARVAPELRLKY
jgi:hypothetical protein